MLAKELRELLASRAFWLLLLIIGPLAGHSFITAVDLYAEASGIGGGPAALAQGLSPLDGILVPTFGAYDLAVTLLFPFIAIRLVSAEKTSGAWKLLLQSPPGVAASMLAKTLALLAGWLLAGIPGLLALALWKLYGGTLYAPETLNLFGGYVLRVLLASGVAAAAASLANSAASAAIVTLGFTVGTWVLDFVAAGRGGLLARLSAYTPTAALRVFEQGEFRLSTAVVTTLAALAGFAVAAVWLDWRYPARRRALASVEVTCLLTVLACGGSLLPSSRDLSENRRNSFPISDERALSRIDQPLRITVYLAAEDPRRVDFDRNIAAKLVRTLPRVEVVYAARTRAGLFEGPADHYGEIWYELAGRRVMSRSTTEPIVLETLYGLAGIQPPTHTDDAVYAGHPLAARPIGARLVYYAVWPLAVILAGFLYLRPVRSA